MHRARVCARPIAIPSPTSRTRWTIATTHLVSGLLVGAGIQQQPHAVCATLFSCPNQRRVSVLRKIFPI